MKRPVSLTLFCGDLIVASLCAPLMVWIQSREAEFDRIMQLKRLPPWATIATGLGFDVLFLVAAAAMLKRYRWGRAICAALLVADLLVTLINNLDEPGRIVVNAVTSMLLFAPIGLWVIFRRPASAYFAAGEEPSMPAGTGAENSGARSR